MNSDFIKFYGAASYQLHTKSAGKKTQALYI